MSKPLLGFAMTEDEYDAWLFEVREVPTVKTGVTYCVQLVDEWDKTAGWPHYEGPDRERAIEVARSKRWDCIATSRVFVTLDRYEDGVLVDAIEF